MKNRIILGVVLTLFAVFAYFYTKGAKIEKQQEALSSWTNNNSVESSSEFTRSETPSAENVATSYFEKVNQLETYLETNPNDTTHILRLARLYQEGHQPVKASAWYEKYLVLQPNDIQSLLDLANTYGEFGNWDKALSVTDKLLVIEPENGKALYNKAAIHANLGNLDEATELWKLIVAQNVDQELVKLSSDALEKISNM